MKIFLQTGLRLWSLCGTRTLLHLAWNMGFKGILAINAFGRRRRQGRVIPPFLFLSITNQCNLHCQGCWVHQTSPPKQITPDHLNQIITSFKRRGSSFFGILGGEPLLYPGLWDVLRQHPDCYFQVFTNGTLLTEEHAKTMRRLGNVTPLISLEGLERVSDERRGGRNVYSGALRGIEHCVRQKLFTGIASSICQSNFDELVNPGFVRQVMNLGASYLWYYMYRPSGMDPHVELALKKHQVFKLRRFLVEERCRTPLMLVDAYWDAQGKALCPAAVGISHHVNPSGQVEPCPPMQCSCDTLRHGEDPVKTIQKSSFLEAFRDYAAKTSRGCPLLDNPQGLADFMKRVNAQDSSGRATHFQELHTRPSCLCSHDLGRFAIPEKNRIYRFAKKHWFFGFGAYG